MRLYALTLDWTITLGTLLQTMTMVFLAIAVFNALSARLTIFENTLKEHAGNLVQQAVRLDRHEEQILEIIKGLQRLIGQSEAALRRALADRP